MFQAFEKLIGLCICEQSVSVTSSQPAMAQQQRCPQGFGLIMVGTCSFAIRSVKNFLLRSVFFLTNAQNMWGCFKWRKETYSLKQSLYFTLNWYSSLKLFSFLKEHCITSRRSETSAWPRCSRCEPRAQCSSHTPAWRIITTSYIIQLETLFHKQL